MKNKHEQVRVKTGEIQMENLSKPVILMTYLYSAP
jgi:hypothetical protein